MPFRSRLPISTANQVQDFYPSRLETGGGSADTETILLCRNAAFLAKVLNMVTAMMM